MSPDPMFAGRRAVVTGASRGIGRAVTLDLLAGGADVVAIARTAEDLSSLVEEGRAGDSPGSIQVAPVDVRDTDRLEAVIEAAEADLLVTAAGINRPAQLVDARVEDLNAILEINVTGTLLTCRAFGRSALSARRHGAVVTLSSQMGVVGYPGRAAYCASKHAVNGLTKALALEWAPHGIRVNAVAPTFVRTPLTAPMFDDPVFERDALERIPLGRIGEVGDITGAVRYLLSDTAAMVTGHVLAVDGGWTAQ